MAKKKKSHLPWNKYMKALKRQWIRRFAAQANREGWDLFDADGMMQIQSLDCPEKGQAHLKGGDGQAYELVAKKALKGSQMHILALYIDGRDGVREIDVPKILLE